MLHVLLILGYALVYNSIFCTKERMFILAAIKTYVWKRLCLHIAVIESVLL